MSDDKWVERRAVRSSSGGGHHIVGKDAYGHYGCSCPGWTRHVYCPTCHCAVKKADTECGCCGLNLEKNKPVRHDCTHIREVKAGGGQTIAEATLERMLG